MAILNLPTFIEQEEKTPEQQMIENLQNMQIDVPVTEVPRFTRFGNRMATRGGFDVLPQEQLAQMTQQQVDEYERQRGQARRAGVSETLLRMGQAFQGMDAAGLAMQRQQAKQAQQQQASLNAVIDQMNIPEPQKNLIKSLSPQQKYNAIYGQKDSQLFKGQGVTNQFYNVLLQGQQDESVRRSPMYKTAYDYLSQPQTETYINEFGQQVTRQKAGIISKEDYLPPTGVTAADEKPVVTEPKEEEVVKVSPERRKDLINNIDTLQNSLVKLTNFEEAVDELQPGIFTIGEERAKIQSLHTSILLELKNLEELGVLAGPDLDLLLGLLGDPTSFQQQFFKGGIAGTKVQIENIKNIINEKKQRFSKELGLKKPEGTITKTKEIAYMPNGRKIEVNATGDGWVYSDTGEAVTQ